MKHVILFLVFTSFVIPLESQAQDQLFGDTLKKDTLAIRLQEAILMALEKNPTVTIQRLSPKIANTYSGEQASVYDPVLTISANKDETKLQRFLGSRPEPFEMTSERRQYDLSLTQALPTGTEISASTSISASISSIYSDQYTGDVGISVTQSLLQGFGVGYNLANLRRAKIDVEISLLELKGIAEQLVADVERSYWDR